jgi:hypothetical protein
VKVSGNIPPIIDAREIADLLAVVERGLADCAVEGVSADWRMNIAYNAGLQAATAAVASSGYRASRDQHHFRIIQSLRETIGVILREGRDGLRPDLRRLVAMRRWPLRYLSCNNIILIARFYTQNILYPHTMPNPEQP